MRDELVFAECNILDVKVASINREQLLLLVDEWVGQQIRKTILYTNAHCMNIASQDTLYREILNRPLRLRDRCRHLAPLPAASPPDQGAFPRGVRRAAADFARAA